MTKVDPDEDKVEVIPPGKKPKATHLQTMSSKPKSILETMLNHLGFDAAVEETALESGSLLNVQTEYDPGRLIGRQGRTWSDLYPLTACSS